MEMHSEFEYADVNLVKRQYSRSASKHSRCAV